MDIVSWLLIKINIAKITTQSLWKICSVGNFDRLKQTNKKTCSRLQSHSKEARHSMYTIKYDILIKVNIFNCVLLQKEHMGLFSRVSWRSAFTEPFSAGTAVDSRRRREARSLPWENLGVYSGPVHHAPSGCLCSWRIPQDDLAPPSPPLKDHLWNSLPLYLCLFLSLSVYLSPVLSLSVSVSLPLSSSLGTCTGNPKESWICQAQDSQRSVVG